MQRSDGEKEPAEYAANAIDSVQQDRIVQKVGSLLTARDEQLRKEYQVMLADILKDLQFQRLEDLEQFSKTVSEHHNTIDFKIKKRDELLKGLIMVSQQKR